MTDRKAVPAANDAERLLDKVFEKVAEVEVPRGATGLLVDLGVQASDGSPGFNLKVRVDGAAAAGAARPAAALKEPSEDDAEVLFGPRGHGTIAFIALEDLKASGRTAVFDKVMAVLTADTLGRADVFAAANWPDKIRPQQPATGKWHFVDIPFDTDAEDGGEPELPEAPHALSQLAEMRAKLPTVTAPKEKADTLCWLLHLVGDLHQPLHCVTRVNSEFPLPDGDRGGNGFKLRGHWKTLHSLWDDSVNLNLPDSAEDLAAAIMKQHTRATLAADLAQKDPVRWARASYAIAVENAYKPLLDAGSTPLPDAGYLRTARSFGQRQAALAGYRLADILAEIFG